MDFSYFIRLSVTVNPYSIIRYATITQPIIINGLRWMIIKVLKRLRECDGNYIKIKILKRDQHFPFLFSLLPLSLLLAQQNWLQFHIHWIKWIFKFPFIIIFVHFIAVYFQLPSGPIWTLERNVSPFQFIRMKRKNTRYL